MNCYLSEDDKQIALRNHGKSSHGKSERKTTIVVKKEEPRGKRYHEDSISDDHHLFTLLKKRIEREQKFT